MSKSDAPTLDIRPETVADLPDEEVVLISKSGLSRQDPKRHKVGPDRETPKCGTPGTFKVRPVDWADRYEIDWCNQCQDASVVASGNRLIECRFCGEPVQKSCWPHHVDTECDGVGGDGTDG